MEIGAKIKAARKTAGLTQKQLCDLLGVHQTAVSQWEIGATQPSIELLYKLLAALDLTFEELINEQGQLLGNLTYSQKIISALRDDGKKSLSYKNPTELTPDELHQIMRVYVYLNECYLPWLKCVMVKHFQDVKEVKA